MIALISYAIKERLNAIQSSVNVMARPRKYTEGLGDLVCEGISEGKSLSRICDGNKNLPNTRTVYSWMRLYPEFLHNYEAAKQDQADRMADEIVEIADEASSENVQVSRLRCDVRKWAASKFKPKKYGDKLETVNTVTHKYEGFTQEELELELKRLQSEL